jgi:ubiquinone/menaquinone biosynthesis C-methylase UbiE
MDNQCKRPRGWFGRRILHNMNARHSTVTDWGLSHATIPRDGMILDVGCGGGRTIVKLAAASGSGKVFGLDHSPDSVRVAIKINAGLVQAGRVEIREGSVSQLPYAADMFDLVTAVETHFFWPDLPGDMLEVKRVVKPGGVFLLIAEVYKGSDAPTSKLMAKHAPRIGMTLLTSEQHRQLLENAGFAQVEVFTEPAKGWVCTRGVKPSGV